MAEVRLQTYWCDCDPAGIVYFGNFFRLFEQVEEELYREPPPVGRSCSMRTASGCRAWKRT